MRALRVAAVVGAGMMVMIPFPAMNGAAAGDARAAAEPTVSATGDTVATGDATRPSSASARPWERALSWLREERDRFSASLDAAHRALTIRAARDPGLLVRLTPAPPVPRAAGYGILPEVGEDAEPGPVAPTRRAYSIETLTTTFTGSIRDAAILALRSAIADADGAVDAVADTASDPAAGTSADLESMVAEFERLRGKLRSLEDHIGYHEFWQRSVVDDGAFFAGRNRINEMVAAWRALADAGSDPARADSLRRDVLATLAPFQPTPGLCVGVEPDGSRVLPVRVLTDIDVPTFLDAFRNGVERTYNESEAAIDRRFRIALDLEIVPVDRLYPDGAPEPGAAVDEKSHLARFPAGALVLTTGARSTHAYTGRYIQLGPEPRTPRTLAHEFGHLIGFNDAYLRAFEGSPDDRFGAVLVEWTGLQDDLMGSPGQGRVTVEMIDRLLAAYGAGQSPAP